MGIITWILFGLIAGAIAKMIMPGTQGGGWLITIILGILGAFVGGAIGVYVLHWGDVTSFWNPRSWILSIGGSLIILWIYGMATKKS
ncbi:GlsB/YeaQ/YmgE family stress response membrane protein [Chryseobacterium cucumeris]|uniref:GlsB/YeaQ/YmgE family stress response membrane protein n=1 Tax=Chryseobacterium cucumeris TaxID=1813611 RepID=A0ABX9X2V3_9FLAO|nr:GlsB/YeaQ/YmgE family stress response membrane protein [Chryseobacterium cucumeris]MDH5031860.1 GlsB/YeaQ/YmgE family stress response membrane protein [Chryseobacterium cucumeris]MDH5036125.1 GlsB/YeaQ/YmgE family stress response membrane protein [Chryseobacterium cucumeris]ROH90143.1 GlsB/YeaQ/YmgE family stress response membrane protein [Chryseobacterium cucumeris]